MSAHFRFANTTKQRAIMHCVLARADKGLYTTTQDIIDNVEYAKKLPTKAIACSFRYLIKWGYLQQVEKAGRKVQVTPTQKAYQRYRYSLGGSGLMS